ncbi:MAG: DNA repair protein RadC [Chthonomonadales bacterium]
MGVDQISDYSARETPIHSSESPRTRLLKFGPESLSNEELVAFVLRTGSGQLDDLQKAQAILKKFHGLFGLSKIGIKDLTARKALSREKAIQLISSVELGRRIASRRVYKGAPITGPEVLAEMVQPELADEKQERFMVATLDTKGHLIELKTITIGILDSSLVHPREVFREAISLSAASIIAIHNHPSGDPTPSEADIVTTKRLVEAGKIVGIELLDHLIIGNPEWISMKRLGHL